MARIDSKPPYDASFPKVGSGEFSRIAKEAAKKRREEKEKESMYAVTDAAATPPAEELLPQEDKEVTIPSTLKEPKAKTNLLPFPRQSFREDIPWAVNGVGISKAEKEATPKVAMPPLAAPQEEREPLNINSIFDPHIDRVGNRVSLREDAPWAKDNPYAFGLEQGFQNQNKFAGKPYDELDKDAVIKSNSLTMGIIGSDPVMKKELNRRKDKLRDFEFIANTPGALASYGLTLTQDEWERIKGEILSGTDSLKDLTPLLHKAKTLRYEEGKEKQETISQVSDRARQLTSEMERAGATKAADQASEADAKFASGLPSPTSGKIWEIMSYNDKLPDTYRATLHLQDHADELSQMNKSVLSNLKKDKSWTGGVWEGFKNNIFTRKAWQDKEGNTYAANEMALYRVIQAYNRGDNSPEVKAVVEMAAELNSAEYFMRSLLPKGYEAGESTAGSVPFMIDFIVTSVLTGGAGSAEKAASKVGASGVKALATRGVLTASGKGTRFLELLARYGQKAAQGVKGVATAVAEKAPGVTRMGERIVKDATQAAIMTATLNTPSVVSDAERRVTPIPYKLEEGDIADMSEFIPINDDHILMEKRFMESNRNKALRKAFTSQWIENYTELAGGHFGAYGEALGKLTHFSSTAAGKAIARINRALSKAPIIGSVRRAANVQGLGGEFLEEIYGGMLNAWLVGDQSMKEVFDAKNMGTTLEALLPTQVAFGILGGGSHAISLAANQRQLAQINKRLKKEFGNVNIDDKRWESCTLSEQGKILDSLIGVYRDAMQRGNEAKDDATRQAAVKEATYARLLFMHLGLQTRRSVLQEAEAEEKLAQTQEKFNTLKQEAENALKAEAKRTTTDREGNSTRARYNDKEYTVYNTEGVTVTQDENGNPHLLGKGTLYLRAPETEDGSAEIIPVPSDQVEVIATQPKEVVDAAIEQSAEAVAEAALQQELATQEAESAPTAQEAETEAAPIPTAQEAETKIAPIPTAQEAETKAAPIPTAQTAETKAAPIPTAQEAEQTETQYLSPEEAARLPEEERTKAISNFNNSLSETDAAIEKLAKEQREYLRKRNTRKRQEETEEDYQNRKAEARKATTGDLQRVNTEMALLQHKKENLIRSLNALHAETPKTEEAASGATESAVNDLNENSPAAHRARGFKLIGGKRIPRQGRVKCYIGRRISAQVSHTEETEGGHYAVIEADDLQPSHFDAAVNERHFIPEAQPKDRATTASFEQQEDFGRNLRVPNLIFSEASIYSGAPVVNARGEVIQGNGRSAGIKSAYRSHPESSGRYKEYLTEHAADWGLKREDVAGMKAPVLVHMLDVDDEEAIRLGQFTDNDVTVTGGTENTKNLLPENVILKLPTEKQGEVARILFASDEADGDKIADEKFSSAFLYLYQHNAISLEEYNSLFTANSLNSQDGVRKPLEAAKRELVTRLLDSVFTKVDPTLKAIVFGRKSVPGIKSEQLNAIKRLLLTDFFFTTSADAQTRARSLRNDLLGALLFISKYPGPSEDTKTEGKDPLRTFLRNMFSAAPVLPGMKSLAESYSPESLEIANLFFKSLEAINAFTHKYYSETNPQTLFEQSEATQSLSKEELFRQAFPFYQEAHRIAYARREASFDAPLTEHYARKESAERGEAGYHKTDFGYESGNKENGKYIAIDKKGNYIEQSEWRNGKRHGISTLYYPNGNVRCEGRFFEGAPAGAFTEYNSRGQLIRHFTFPKDGREATGVYTDYYQNEAHSVEGCIRSKGAFKAGQREGVWKHYDREGNLILTENYSHGALQGSYLKLQPVGESFGGHVQAQYVDGQPEGRYIEMHEGSDAVKFDGSIENGKFVGKRDGSGSPYLLGEPLHTTFDLSTDAFGHGERKEITLTDKEGNSLTVQLSSETDRNGKPYVLTSDGKLSYGVIPGGLVPEEPKTKEVRLSLGNDVREEGTYRYGLAHIMEEHFAQMKSFGFDTVEAYIKHVLTHINRAVLEKKRKNGVSYFVVTVPFPSSKHPDENLMDSLLVTLYDDDDHWEIINSWRTSEFYIKRKEQEPSVPTVGLPYATNRAEGREHGTSEGSNPGHSVGTLNLSLSDDKDTKKSEPSDAPLTKQNDFGAEEGVQKSEETISLPKEDKPLEEENYGRTERKDERSAAADSRVGKEPRLQSDGSTGDSVHGSSSDNTGDPVQRSTGVHSGRTTDLRETSTSTKAAEGANASQGNLQDAFVPSAFTLPQTEQGRLEANVDALILLYEIEAEGRKATPKEQEILAKYTGWGGLSSSLFNFLANEKRNATERSRRLSEFIDDKELVAIVRNAETAFYTPDYVCDALWDIAKRLGFKGGNVLEPAMGVGRIIQHMPNSLRNGVSLSGYEKDDFSGRIARLLYPNAAIAVDGYENEPLKHPYDLIIANVPFGQNAPFDRKLSRQLARKLGRAYNLHNFFIAKGFNSLSEGGIAIYITSRHTLDSACDKLRSYAGEMGVDFLGAIRLPSDTFTSTGTAVVSDILVFRKRRAGEEPIDIKYLGLKDLPEDEVVQYDDTPFAVNEYFDTHPQQVLGSYRGERERNSYMPQRVFKGNLTLYAFPGKEPAKELQEAIKRLELKKGKINTELREQPVEAQPFQEGRLSVVGDEVYRYADGEKSCIIGEGGVAVDTFRHKGKKIKCVEAIKAYTDLRDLLLAQVELESKEDATDKEIEDHRKLLSDAYHAYTDQYGLVTEHKELKSILEEDADSYLVFGLEHTENNLVQDKAGKVRLVRELKTRDESILDKRTCFPTRVPDKADNITDAVNISRAYKNKLDVDYIATLRGSDAAHVRSELIAHGYAYEDPITNEIVDSVEYLSGDVVTKLAEAKENNEQGKYDHNVEALTAVQPERVIYSNIAVSLQSSWIPKEIKENFLREKICEYNVTLYDDPVSGEHRVARFISGEIFSGLPTGVITKKNYPNEITNYALSARPTSLWKITKDTGFKDNRGYSIRVPDEEAMNAVKVTVERIKQMFVDWLEEKEEHRTKIEDIYNEKFNRQRLPEYPVPQIEYYPNAAHGIKLYEHQKKAVSRALSQSTLFAHEVGTGKTFTMVTTAMEMRRLGLAKKPMIVVQNATIGGFVTDARKLYPQAKILAPGKRDMSAENRKRLLGKIATGDYDMVIVPTSFLKLIPDSPKARDDYYESLKKQFREKIEAAQNSANRSACRELQKSLCKLMEDEAKATEKAEQTLDKKTNRRTDDILTFDKLNVDALFLDEAHQYKKLGLITNLGQIKGVDTQSSEQAVSAYLKILDVRRKSGGKNVILATGTPVSNTMAEIWTMMRYINPDVLEAYGMTSFDDFASTYGEITEDLEYKMDQTFKLVARFKKFVHLNELLTAWRMCADVVRTLDVKELQQGNRIPKLKGGQYTQVVLPKGDALNDAILQIVDAIEANEKRHGDDKLPALNVVAHTLAKQASIDLRLLNPALPNEPSSKTNAAVQKIYEKYKETDDIKGTQLVFLDIFQSKDPSKGGSSSPYDIFHAGDASTRFNAYEYIRDELVKKGIPRSEIACITDIKDGQTADVKREALFEKVRNGEVRVLLGSTEKMGVGVNVQTRLCALHHLDIVNRPMDFAQRNGRMLRNGNTLAQMGREVEIFVYGTEETLDAASYNRLQSKLNFTAPVMAPLNASITETEDVSDENALQMTSAELTAALSGSTTAVDLHEANDRLQRLTTEKKMHDRKRDENSARLRQYTNDIAVLPKLIEDTKAAEKGLQEDHPALYSETQEGEKKHTSAQGWYKDIYIDGKKAKEPLNELTKFIDKVKGSLPHLAKENNEIRIDNHITVKIGSRSLGEAYIEQITVDGVPLPMDLLSDRGALSNGQGLITRVYNKLMRDFVHVQVPRMEHALEKRTAFVEGYKDLGAFPKLNELRTAEEEVATLKQKLLEEGKAAEEERARRQAERSAQEVQEAEAKPTDEDVQYRKGVQDGDARALDAPLETFTPERARDTLAKLRAAKPIAVDVAKARELYDFTPKGVRTWILNTLRNRTFKNEDTGENDIILSRRGAYKFVSHGMHNEVRAASASVIPELIYKGIFIGETNAEKDDANYVRYRYYVAGLKVSEEEYTVKIVVGIDENGKQYYDQELTAIEKGRLIDILNQPAEGFTATAGEPIPSTSLTGKDTKLLSLLGDLKKKAGEAWEATSNPQSAEDEVAQHNAYRHALTTQYGEAARDTEADKARKQRVAEDALRKLGLEGVPVEVVSRSEVAEAYARDAMGWHDRKTGKVTIVAENNELEDIEATVLHEVVGHHGLEALLGKEGLATLTHEVLPLIPEAERKRLEDTYGTNEQTIAEEYIAEMAEQYTPPSVWARIAGFIRNLLRRIGFRLPLTNGDLLYLTWRGIRATRKEQSSTDALLHRADEKRVISRCRDLDDIQFRKPRKQILSELAADGVDEKGVLKLTEAMNELLEKRVYKLRETWQNDTQSFIELARCVEAATGETIPDEMNLDKVYNQSASKAFARQEETRKKYDEMMQTVRRFARKAQLSPELTELYFLAKHAPERNAEMRRRAEEMFDPTMRTEEQEEILNDYYNKLFPGWYKQHEDVYTGKAEAEEAFFDALKDALTTKDYAAEEAITERIATLIKQDKKSPYRAVVNEADPLRAFTQAVEARAGHQDVYHVWQLVNGFNRGTIELWRNSGMIDEATYQKVTGMFAHYVPMQGWKENTNQTPWEYSIRTHIDTNPLKTMHGRQSLPGSPFEAMLKSAMNSIVAATRNEERQALYFFAQQYGSDYLSASSAWYVLQQEGDKKRWVEAYPETVTRKTEKGDAIESTTRETAEAFFARMKELESRGLARRRTQRTRPETGYLLSERQEQEHVVPLFFDGQKYNVFVNGNPRFSRAATRHNRATDSNGAADKLLRSVRWFTREMGQNITGRSLSFGAANMVRDLLFAEMSSSTIYGTRYALAFNRAYFTDVIPLMLGLKKGDTARLYEEYKANGGRTGFAFLTGDKRSAQSTRNALSNSLKARAGRAGRSFWNAYMGINEHLEDMSRFAAYAAARKIGLGITEATHRAKSITVNFNKRGTGNSPMYQFLSTLYLFFNANLQGVALTGKMFRDHPWRAAGWSLGLILLQPLMTILYTALASPDGDDGDDEDETLQERYDRLPLKDVNPFLRRSNICIPLGEGKLIKVPLGPEMRALNGIGVTLSDMLMGRATSGDLALATIDGALNSSSIGLDMSLSGFTDANELAERGERGALYTALRGSIPSALQPFGDIAANRDWSGRRIYGESIYHRGTPSYLYADKSTPRWMTNAAAGWNTMLYGQGDKHIGEVSTGLLSVNPSSVNYLAERYLGGILEFVTDLNRTADMLTDPKGGSVSQALGQAPVTRRFWKDDPMMQGSEARRNFYRRRRALHQDIERIDRMKRNAKGADYKEANEIRNSIRTYLNGRNEMQLRYLAKRFDTLSDTMQAHDEAYAGRDTATRLSVRERDTRAIERLLKEAERLEAVTK